MHNLTVDKKIRDHSNNVLLISRSIGNVFMYDYSTNQISEIYSLDDLTEKTEIIDIRNEISKKLM